MVRGNSILRLRSGGLFMPMGLICYASWRKRWVYCSESRGWLIARRRSESSRPYLGVMRVAKAQDRE